MVPGTDDLHAFDACLHSIEIALQGNQRRTEAMVAQLERIRSQLEAGTTIGAVVDELDEPLFVTLLSESVEELTRHGHRCRMALAAALHDEGLTMESIAVHFKVTRQRVSALLREYRATAGDAG